jgi:hypothetical protein
MSDFAATDLNSKATGFGIHKTKTNQQLLLSISAKPFQFQQNPSNLTIKS